jgi:two-component system OmpR family response regulator
MRILLAEDDPAIASLVSGQLEAAGFLIDVATHGPEIWERGETTDYAAIILDLGLPGMDGLSILKRWRQAGMQTPVPTTTFPSPFVPRNCWRA